MYNKKQKDRYLDTIVNSGVKRTILTAFCYSTLEEERLQKDVSTFNEKEIIALLQGYGSSTYRSLEVLLTQFRNYANWCDSQKLTTTYINGYGSLSATDLRRLIKLRNPKSLYSRKQILMFCSTLVNASDRFFLLGLFEGIKGKDLYEFANLAIEDVSPDKFRLTGETPEDTREFIPSPELYQYALDSYDETSYITVRGMSRSVTADKYIIHNRTSTPSANPLPRMRARLKRIQDELDVQQLSVAVLRWSGISSYVLDGKDNNIENIKEYLHSTSNTNYKYLEKQYDQQFGSSNVRRTLNEYVLQMEAGSSESL